MGRGLITPTTYFKKLINSNDIWEVRVRSGRNIFRFLGFYDGSQLIILTNGFQKKSQKTPKCEMGAFQIFCIETITVGPVSQTGLVQNVNSG